MEKLVLFIIGFGVFLIGVGYFLERIYDRLPLKKVRTFFFLDQLIILYVVLGFVGATYVGYVWEFIQTEFGVVDDVLCGTHGDIPGKNTLWGITMTAFLVVSGGIHLWGESIVTKKAEKMPWQLNFKFSFPIMVGAALLFYYLRYVLNLF